MEELLVYALLSAVGMEEEERYFECLHTLFLTSPEAPVLLELEWERDLREAVKTMLKMEEPIYDKPSFGKRLMNRVELHYRVCNTVMELKEFGERCYQLWGILPGSLAEGTFNPLNYAQDSLSYGDESQCREIFEQMFHAYDSAD